MGYFGERKLANFREPPLRDRRYLDSFRDRACDACGTQDGTIVGAHIRTGHEGGAALKPPDDLVMALCGECHRAEHATQDGSVWIKVLKRIARNRYVRWKASRAAQSIGRQWK